MKDRSLRAHTGLVPRPWCGALPCEMLGVQPHLFTVSHGESLYFRAFGAAVEPRSTGLGLITGHVRPRRTAPKAHSSRSPTVLRHVQIL